MFMKYIKHYEVYSYVIKSPYSLVRVIKNPYLCTVKDRVYETLYSQDESHTLEELKITI